MNTINIDDLVEKIKLIEKKKMEYEYELNSLKTKKEEIEKTLKEMGIDPANLKTELEVLQTEIENTAKELEEVLNERNFE